MSVTRLRPSMLYSAIARKNLTEHEELAVRSSASSTVAQMFEAFECLQSAPDPLKTAEANALAYKAAHEEPRRARMRWSNQQIDGVCRPGGEHQAISAREKAGLTKPSPHAAEIRAAFRSMTQKERDEAMGRAIDRGENEVLASIIDVPRMLIGDITLALGHLIDLAVRPGGAGMPAEHRGNRRRARAYEAGLGNLHEMRRRCGTQGLERAGEEGAAKANDATAALDAALA